MALSAKGAGGLTRKELARIRRAMDAIGPRCRKSATVPPLPGLTPAMRRWSAGRILWHTTRINHAIRAIVVELAGGRGRWISPPSTGPPPMRVRSSSPP